MAERTYTYDHVDAAMCIWEEITNPTLKDGAPTPWADYREQWGAAGLRDAVITNLAWPCHEAWCRALERYAAAETAPDPGSFDWEFVPLWIRECVDWSGEHPRVKGLRTGTEEMSVGDRVTFGSVTAVVEKLL